MWKPVLASILTTVAVALPARSAVLNDYSQTDDVWNTPLAEGHKLVDVRTTFGFSTGGLGLTAFPSGSYVYGFGSGGEIGIWSALGGAGIGGLVGSVNPYVKYLLPVTLGSVGLGLVAGGQIPTGVATEGNLGLEGVALVPLAKGLDLGAGIGRSLKTGAMLGHFNAALYLPAPAGGTLVGEVYTNLSTLAAPLFGQHLGLQLPFGKGWSGDLGVAFTETSTGFAGTVPQIGLTLAL